MKRIVPILLLCLAIAITAGAQEVGVDSNTIVSDSLQAQSDTSIAADSLPPKRVSTLDHEVDYESADSMIVDFRTQKVYLYGDASAIYGDIILKADFIEISLESSELRATGLPDSTGEIAGEPVFTQGDQTFDAGEMRYNFKTKRGLSKEVKTQESGGYLHGETVKRDTGEIIYIQDGKFTTCEYDDPHFHIHAGKLKVIPKDKIITGPAYLTIAGIPTPLALPFGYFPNTEKRANGILLPSWGDTRQQGFALRGGGYYFGLGEHMDFAVTADVYSRGGWAGYVQSNYATRYKYRGSYRLNYVSTVFSEKGYPDYYQANTFNVNWTHNQDARARPGTSFSASVDAGSSKSYRNNLNSSTNDFLKSQMNSNIRYAKIFDNSPFNFGVSASASQNTQTKDVVIRAPQASLNMQRIFPFKPKTPVSSKSLISRLGIDNIGINGSADLVNRLSGKEDTIFNNYDNRVFKNMQNGLKVTSSASTNIKLLKYITLNPRTTHKFVGYRKTLRKRWNADSARVEEYYVNGLDGFYDGSAAASLTTIVYGTYSFKSDLIRAMRHQMTPTVGISYSPDYSQPHWGYYDKVQENEDGDLELYSYFEDGVFSDNPQAKESGVVDFNLNNTFELKVRDRADSTSKTGEKKIRLVDAFNFSTRYNLAVDSLRWNSVNIQFRTQALKGFVINGQAVLDPYAYNAEGTRINRAQYAVDGTIGRWTSANLALSYNIKPKETSKKKKPNQEQPARVGYYTDFVNYDLPWNVNVKYNIRYTNTGTTEKVTQVLDLQGQMQLTRNWQVGYRTGIDIVDQDITYSSFEIYRDLHCWEFTLAVVPFGPRQNYNFEIKVKPGMLDALKIPRKRSFDSVPIRD